MRTALDTRLTVDLVLALRRRLDLRGGCPLEKLPRKFRCQTFDARKNLNITYCQDNIDEVELMGGWTIHLRTTLSCLSCSPRRVNTHLYSQLKLCYVFFSPVHLTKYILKMTTHLIREATRLFVTTCPFAELFHPDTYCINKHCIGTES